MSENPFSDLEDAVRNVVLKLKGINKLYPIQLKLLETLLKYDNVFFTRKGFKHIKILIGIFQLGSQPTHPPSLPIGKIIHVFHCLF